MQVALGVVAKYRVNCYVNLTELINLYSLWYQKTIDGNSQPRAHALPTELSGRRWDFAYTVTSLD